MTDRLNGAADRIATDADSSHLLVIPSDDGVSLLADRIASVLQEELDWDWEAVPAEHIPSSASILHGIAARLVERLAAWGFGGSTSPGEEAVDVPSLLESLAAKYIRASEGTDRLTRYGLEVAARLLAEEANAFRNPHPPTSHKPTEQEQAR